MKLTILIVSLLLYFGFNSNAQNKFLVISEQTIENLQLVNTSNKKPGLIKTWENIKNTYLINCDEPRKTFLKCDNFATFKLYRFDTGESTDWIGSTQISNLTIEKSFETLAQKNYEGAKIATEFSVFLQQWLEILKEKKESDVIEEMDDENVLEPRVKVFKDQDIETVNFAFVTNKSNKFNKKEDIFIKWETSQKVREAYIVDAKKNVKLWTAKDMPEKYIDFNFIKKMQPSELNLQTGRNYKLCILLNKPNADGTIIRTTDFTIESLVFVTTNRQPFLVTDSINIKWNSSVTIKEISLIDKKTNSIAWNTKSYKKTDIAYSDIKTKLKTKLLPRNLYQIKILLDGDKPDKNYILDFEILFDKAGYTQYLNFISD